MSMWSRWDLETRGCQPGMLKTHALQTLGKGKVVTSGRERERDDDDYMGWLVDTGGPTNGTHVVAALVTSFEGKKGKWTGV